jgi:RNA polymerase sigma factor (sigma-70 family)
MDNGSKTQWIVDALNQHESNLIRYATWILSDIERAREVVQETFLRLCKEKPERLGGHLPQWLFTVCRNLAFDVRKKEKRMSPLQDAEASEPAAAAKTAAMLEQKEAMGQVLRVVETLPKNQREVIYLKFQCDLSYKEISDITSLSITNVGFLIHTAIKSIRKQVLTSPEPVRRTQ